VKKMQAQLEIKSIEFSESAVLAIDDLAFCQIAEGHETEELAGEGPIGAGAAAAIGGAAGAVAGFAGYTAGRAYDGVTGGGWNWSWRDAGRDTVVGGVTGAVGGAAVVLLTPTP
jgi:hypothetical protein